MFRSLISVETCYDLNQVGWIILRFFGVVEPFWGLRIWLGFSVVNVAVCGFHFINMWLLCVCVPKHVHLVISNLLFVKYRAGLSCQMVK